MTEPIANGATSPVQPDTVDEDTMTTGAPIDEGDAYESTTVPPAPEQTEANNKLAIQVEEVTYEVVNPKLGANIVDLGPVYDIWIEEGDIAATSVALTSLTRPLTDMLTGQTVSRVMKTESIHGFRLSWAWSPAWGPHMVIEGGREQMRVLGSSV